MNISDKRIVFMGTPAFAANILEGLIKNGFNIVGAVCQPDKEYGRKRQLRACEVKQLCNEFNVPVYSPLKIRKDYEDIINLKPDLIVTAAYGQIIPKQLLDLPEYGCINAHGSLLPKYRGGAPIQRAIINGEDKTGISIMYMDEKMDEGDIIYQKSIDIDIHDTSSILFDKLSNLALDMLIEIIPKIFECDISPVKQDHSLASYAYNLDKQIEHIDFYDKTINVYNHIRGLLDNPGCYFMYDNKRYRIESAFYSLCDNTIANTFVGLENNYLRIDCTDGYIEVYKIKPEGKNSMDAKAFFNGAGRNMIGVTLG